MKMEVRIVVVGDGNENRIKRIELYELIPQPSTCLF
jgi:hypothetical protein